MTKETRVKLWHPGYLAEANPLKEDVPVWLEKGWVKEIPQKPPVNNEGEEK